MDYFRDGFELRPYHISVESDFLVGMLKQFRWLVRGGAKKISLVRFNPHEKMVTAKFARLDHTISENIGHPFPGPFAAQPFRQVALMS